MKRTYVNACLEEDRDLFRALYLPSTEAQRQAVERSRNAQRVIEWRVRKTLRVVRGNA